MLMASQEMATVVVSVWKERLRARYQAKANCRKPRVLVFLLSAQRVVEVAR